MAQPVPRGIKLFLGLFIVVGVIAFGAGVWNLVRSLRCENWPVAEGVIESAEMKSNSDNDGGTTYSAVLTYHYQVAGNNYTGKKLAFGAMSSSSAYAQGILNRYPVGKKVVVHHSPVDPELAVLETGIHGGTWICFAVGTVFVLVGMMFLQFQRAARPMVGGELPDSAAVTRNPDGTISTQRPPILMGVIFALMGSFVCFAPPTSGTPNWVIYAAGGMFVACGLFIFTGRLRNKIFSKFFMALIVLAFLAIFHWVSFGAGERIGTSSTPFSTQSGVDVKAPFAICTVLMDLALLAGGIHWLLKRRKD